MWDDIIIGNGDIGCTTIKCWDHDNTDWCNLSENSVGYIVSMPQILNSGGMTIFKGTREGNKIKTLLSFNQDEKLNNYLLKLFFSKVKPEIVFKAIESAYYTGVKDGKELKQLELQRVLGL